MTLARTTRPAWTQPDDSIRSSDRKFTAFLADVGRHGLRSKTERDRVEAIQRRARQTKIAAFTGRQIKVGERILGITGVDR